MRILSGGSFYQDWDAEPPFVKEDPLGNPVDHRHPWNQTTIPKAVACGFHEAVRGILSHHSVIRDGKIANYHPYPPPTRWNASPRDPEGVSGPYEDAIIGTPLFEENPPETFKGIDVMRTVRSFDPCLPCGVHMYLGEGRTLDVCRVPTYSTRPLEE